MYYAETIINGVLHCRTTPNGEWRPLTPEQLTAKLVELNARLAVATEPEAS